MSLAIFRWLGAPVLGAAVPARLQCSGAAWLRCFGACVAPVLWCFGASVPAWLRCFGAQVLAWLQCSGAPVPAWLRCASACVPRNYADKFIHPIYDHILSVLVPLVNLHYCYEMKTGIPPPTIIITTTHLFTCCSLFPPAAPSLPLPSCCSLAPSSLLLLRFKGFVQLKSPTSRLLLRFRGFV